MKTDTDKSKKVKNADPEIPEEKVEQDAYALQIEELDNKYKRVLADYQNLQRRAQEERVEWIRSANKELLLRMLTIFDTLLLAKQHIAESDGLQVVINQFLDLLKAEGVVRIETVGLAFDPHLMEAIAAGEGKEGMVIAEIRTGFMIHDKLLRPAQVMVGKQADE